MDMFPKRSEQKPKTRVKNATQSTKTLVPVSFEDLPSAVFCPHPVWMHQFRSRAMRAWRKSGLESPVEVVFTSPKKMQELSAQFMGLDKATDVLTFSPGMFYDELPYAMPKEIAAEQTASIVLCWDKVQTQAIHYKLKLEEEAIRLFVHGLAHLKGWNHENNSEDEQEMLAYERSILTTLRLGDIY